jgi:hypothetical protein
VQTFDIARLTTHPVPIVPGTFNVVTGLGPKVDSNDSGKTTFLAAVSLLHADAQWRLETDHGRYACGLLFKPSVGGVADAQYRPADHGYIVGVFADQGGALDGQLTVWMRVSLSAPYVLVRHTDGLHVAHGESDQERYDRPTHCGMRWASPAHSGRASSPAPCTATRPGASPTWTRPCGRARRR